VYFNIGCPGENDNLAVTGGVVGGILALLILIIVLIIFLHPQVRKMVLPYKDRKRLSVTRDVELDE